MKHALLALLVLAPAVHADADFDRTVAPVFAKHCLSCHGEDKQRGELDLRSAAKTLAGGASGPVVVPGRAEESLLVQLLTPKARPHMPPKGQLSDVEIAVVKNWIDKQQPTVATVPAKASTHWAFQKVTRPAVPEVRNEDWVRSPVDRFILARLESKGLRPSSPASRADLLRRVTLDLTGLPPTPAEVEAALADRSAEWYETVVDRLLASPAYGERWGRHWLDLARYADSSGFHNDLDRPHAWRYRDYVIQSFNDDKPYGQFLREQLAGDEIAPGDPTALAATGFCINGPSNEDNMGQQAEQHRLDALDDVIATTGQVFLGLTLGCARCHDHKYDPVSIQDYYRLLAVFNNSVKKTLPVQGTTLVAFTEANSTPRKTRLLWRGDLSNPGPEVQPGVPAALAAQALAFPAPEAGATTTGRRRVLADWIAAPENPLTWRVLANRLWQYHFGRGLVASSSNFGLNGDRPTHPELLDWLALELVRHDGRLKPVHRLLVTSAVYRQASQASAELIAADPTNLLLGRMSKRRLEAEAIRDTILAVSGSLNPQAGGPGIKPRIPAGLLDASQRNKWPRVERESAPHWRRSVYVYVKRQLRLPLLEAFDAPTASNSCERRPESTVPTQALVLMNDEFTQDQAARFAQRVIRIAGNDAAAQVQQTFLLALGKPASLAREADAVVFLQQQRQMHAKAGADEAARRALTDLAHVLFNSSEFVFVD